MRTISKSGQRTEHRRKECELRDGVVRRGYRDRLGVLWTYDNTGIMDVCYQMQPVESVE